MDLTAKTANTCRSYQANGSSIRLGPLDFPEFGDQTFAAHATGTSPLGVVDSDLIYVRKGSRVMSLQTISIGPAKITNELVLFLTRGVANRL